MASVYDLKPAFQGLLRPLVRALARRGVRANHVTVAAFCLSLAAGGTLAAFPLARWPLLCLAPVLFLRMALNAVDGMLAREHGQKTTLGAFLNELGDVGSDAALYLPLALVPGFEPRLVVAIVILALAGEMAGVLAAQLGASRRYDGPMGKSDRAFVLGALGLALGLGAPAEPWLTPLLVLVGVLLVLTLVNRVRRGLAEILARAAPGG